MSINSKQKGKRFELELAHKLQDYGFTEARRTAQYCGKTEESSDVIGLKGIHIEAKHQETLKIYDWMAQAIRDSEGTENKPCVFFRKNHEDILVTMRFEDFMDLYIKAYGGPEKDESNRTETEV